MEILITGSKGFIGQNLCNYLKYKNYSILTPSKKELNLDENSIVYTSGSGGNFRSGLPIGIINNQIDKFAVEFFSDLSQLSYVKIQSIENF